MSILRETNLWPYKGDSQTVQAHQKKSRRVGRGVGELGKGGDVRNRERERNMGKMDEGDRGIGRVERERLQFVRLSTSISLSLSPNYLNYFIHTFLVMSMFAYAEQ